MVPPCFFYFLLCTMFCRLIIQYYMYHHAISMVFDIYSVFRHVTQYYLGIWACIIELPCFFDILFLDIYNGTNMLLTCTLDPVMVCHFQTCTMLLPCFIEHYLIFFRHDPWNNKVFWACIQWQYDGIFFRQIEVCSKFCDTWIWYIKVLWYYRMMTVL